MKTFKITDIVIQAVLMVAGVAIPVLFPDEISFFYSYYLLGSWQLFSCLVHALAAGGWPTDNRNYYLHTLKWTFLLGILSLLLELVQVHLLIVYLYLLLFITPVMGFHYLWICIREWNSLRKRALIHLK